MRDKLYGFENGYFGKGWADWDLYHKDTANLSATDGVYSGLIEGRENLVGFPTVGDNYMLMFRTFTKAGAANNFVADLVTKGSYNIPVNSKIVFDVGYDILAITATVTLAVLLNYGPYDYGGADYGTNLDSYSILDSTNQAVGIHRQQVAFNVWTALNAQVIIRLNIAIGAAEALEMRYFSVDNFRIFKPIEYNTPAESNDSSGVTTP